MTKITDKLLYAPVFAAIEGTVTPNPGARTINELIANALTNYIIPLAGALAVGFVIYGGLLYIMSAGDPEKTTKAKKTLLWAIAGVFIISLSVVLVGLLTTTINDNILR
jgi:Na+-driven multidrug efflux pump